MTDDRIVRPSYPPEDEARPAGVSARRAVVTALLAVLFGSASLVDLGSDTTPVPPAVLKLRYVLVAASLGGLLLCGVRVRWVFRRGAVPVLFCWALFGVSVAAAGLANGDSLLLQNGVWLAGAVPVIFFYVLPNLLPRGGMSTAVAAATVAGHLPYVVVSLVAAPPTSMLYQGVFPNSNTMGLIGAGLGTGALVLMTGRGVSVASAGGLTAAAAFVLGVGVVLLSSARTSLLTLLLLSAVAVVCSARPWRIVRALVVAALPVVVVAVSLFGDQLAELASFVGEGLAEKGSSDDMLRGRGEIWAQTVSEAVLFGHGSTYFDVYVGMAAHNSVIEFLGKAGAAAAAALAVVAVASVVLAVRYYRSRPEGDDRPLGPLLVTLSFWLLAMGEGMFGSLGKAMTLAYMSVLGVIMTKPVVPKSRAAVVALILAACASAPRPAPADAGEAEIRFKGEPFFPFGFYLTADSPEDTARDVREISDAGFDTVNLFWSNGIVLPRFFDEADRAGIAAIVELKGEEPLGPVRKFKGRPSLLAWSIGDDAGDHGPPEALAARHRAVKEADPAVMTYTSISGYSNKWPEYAGVADVIGGQSYPIDRKKGKLPFTLDRPGLEVFRIFSYGREHAAARGRPAVANLQTFRWDKGRLPFPSEIRGMTYQAVVAGVRGVVYYTYRNKAGSVRDDADLWLSLKAMVPEMKDLAPFLAGGKRTPVAASSPDVVGAEWTLGDRRRAIFVNTSPEERRGVRAGGVLRDFRGRDVVIVK